MVLPSFGVTPYAGLQAQDFHTPAYSETDLTGGGFGLSYAAMNATDRGANSARASTIRRSSTACRSSCAGASPGRTTG